MQPNRPYRRYARANFVSALISSAFSASLFALSLVATNVQASNEGATMSERKQQVVDLLKSLETGDSKPVGYINPNKYIQHNLAVGDGMAGLGVLFASLPKGATKVNVVRAFEDGDFVFVHVEYDFFGPKIGFDVFRYEDGKIVEHWDNLQQTPATPSPSGHTMIDGPTKPNDLDKTAANKALMQAYMDDIVFNRRREKFPVYFDGNNYIQHNPWVADQLTGLAAGLQALAKEGRAVHYDRVHKILGEGSFVLVISEGTLGDQSTAYYDLFRIEQGKIVEHWDTLEAIPPRSEWKNSNGKFGFGSAM